MTNSLLIADDLASSADEASKVQDSMSNEELSEYLRNKSPAQILEAAVKAEPRLGGMPRAYNDGHVIRSDGIEAIFSDASATRGPIIFGTNRYETKLFNMSREIDTLLEGLNRSEQKDETQ